ncbi:hypothetical protein NIES3275_18320 [Microchaete diplosiphon NIES-3275]|nr:hypothetical protein NIES3275_18320 [Microchaete diplosiphon NIES-3275]
MIAPNVLEMEQASLVWIMSNPEAISIVSFNLPTKALSCELKISSCLWRKN